MNQTENRFDSKPTWACTQTIEIELPVDAISYMSKLIPYTLWGTDIFAIARQLVLDQLKQLSQTALKLPEQSGIFPVGPTRNIEEN